MQYLNSVLKADEDWHLNESIDPETVNLWQLVTIITLNFLYLITQLTFFWTSLWCSWKSCTSELIWANLWITSSQCKRLSSTSTSVNSGATIWPEEAVPTEHFVTDGVLQIQSWHVVQRAGSIVSISMVHLPLGSGNVLRTLMGTCSSRMCRFYNSGNILWERVFIYILLKVWWCNTVG